MAPARSRTWPGVAGLVASRGVLGLGVVICVAWAAAVYASFPSSHEPILQEAYGARDWLLVARSRWYASVRYTSVLMIRALEYKESPQTEQLPGWVTIPDPPPTASSGFTDHYELVDGYGWPWPALGFQFHGRGRGAATAGDVTGGITLKPRSTGAWYDPRALPLTPIWPGLALDIAVATGLVVLVVDGPRAVRRALRRRRAQCVSCGYDLRGLGAAACPECGTTRDTP